MTPGGSGISLVIQFELAETAEGIGVPRPQFEYPQEVRASVGGEVERPEGFSAPLVRQPILGKSGDPDRKPTHRGDRLVRVTVPLGEPFEDLPFGRMAREN